MAGVPGLAAAEKPLPTFEVLQFRHAVYDVWYDVLNAGFRMTATAGTDYPSYDSVPGQERFYVQAPRPFTYEGWLDGVRRGRTFVTNGPVLDFRVNGQSIGGEIALPGPQ